MKHLKSAVAGLLLLAIASASSLAFADRGGYGHRGGHHGGGGRVGIYLGVPAIGFGLPFYGGYTGYGYGGYGNYGGYGPYAPYGYYGPSTTIITAPAPPPVYIEQNSTVPNGPASDGYWYYCHNPDGYYPYVRQCAENWQQVPSQPAGR